MGKVTIHFNHRYHRLMSWKSWKSWKRREAGREGKIFNDHRQDSKVAVGGIGNLARWGPSAVSEIQTNKQKNTVFPRR